MRVGVQGQRGVATCLSTCNFTRNLTCKRGARKEVEGGEGEAFEQQQQQRRWVLLLLLLYVAAPAGPTFDFRTNV